MIRKVDFTTQNKEALDAKLVSKLVSESLLLKSSLVIEELQSYLLEALYPDFDDFRANLNGEELNQIITERADVFGMHTTLLALRRTLRPQPNEKENNLTKEDKCIFDNLSTVSKPVIEIDKGKIYSTPNPFAFNSGDHEVIFTREHIEFINEIKLEHINGILSGLFQRGEFMLKHPSVNQISSGINFGTAKMKHSAGASIPHLHAQIGAVYNSSYFPLSDCMRNILLAYRKEGIDFLLQYLKNLKEDGFYILEGEFFTIFTPFAPRFKDEIHIVSNFDDISSLVSLKDGPVLEELSDLVFKVIKFLDYIGVGSFNISISGRRLGNIEDPNRLLVRIMPRESDIAYSELLGRYVVDRYPEKSAQMFRDYLKSI